MSAVAFKAVEKPAEEPKRKSEKTTDSVELSEKKKFIAEGATLKGVASPGTKIGVPIIPPPRPQGVVIRYPIHYTDTRLNVSFYDPTGKGKAKVVEKIITKPLKAVQTQINL